jgi:hypothetical protein
MPCDINHNWPMQAYNLSPPDITGSGSCVVQNHTTFFYSNFPEKLLEADMNQGVATLWEDTHLFAAFSSFSHYKCYLWHINQLPWSCKAGLVLENLGASSLQVGSAQGALVTNEGPPLPATYPAPFQRQPSQAACGKCIAQSMLYAGLDNVTLANSQVPAYSRRVLLEWYPLSPGKIYGVYLEFTISGMPGSGPWVLREVFSVAPPLQDLTVTHKSDAPTLTAVRGLRKVLL